MQIMSFIARWCLDRTLADQISIFLGLFMPLVLTVSFFVCCVVFLAILFKLVSDEKYASLKKIHREQKVGSLISGLALGWGGFQGYELLGQDFPSIASLFPIITPLLIIGVYFLMDYIFTRALGGFMIMLVCELLFRTQEVHMVGRILFSLGAYVVAVAGMYMIGQPWKFRDLVFKASEDKSFGTKLSAVISVLLLSMIIPFAIAYV